MPGARPLIAGMVRPGMVNVRAAAGVPVNVRGGVPFRPGMPRNGAPLRAAPNGVPIRGGLQQRPIVRYRVPFYRQSSGRVAVAALISED